MQLKRRAQGVGAERPHKYRRARQHDDGHRAYTKRYHYPIPHLYDYPYQSSDDSDDSEDDDDDDDKENRGHDDYYGKNKDLYKEIACYVREKEASNRIKPNFVPKFKGTSTQMWIDNIEDQFEQRNIFSEKARYNAARQVIPLEILENLRPWMSKTGPDQWSKLKKGMLQRYPEVELNERIDMLSENTCDKGPKQLMMKLVADAGLDTANINKTTAALVLNIFKQKLPDYLHDIAAQADPNKPLLQIAEKCQRVWKSYKKREMETQDKKLEEELRNYKLERTVDQLTAKLEKLTTAQMQREKILYVDNSGQAQNTSSTAATSDGNQNAYNQQQRQNNYNDPQERQNYNNQQQQGNRYGQRRTSKEFIDYKNYTISKDGDKNQVRRRADPNNPPAPGPGHLKDGCCPTWSIHHGKWGEKCFEHLCNGDNPVCNFKKYFLG